MDKRFEFVLPTDEARRLLDELAAAPDRLAGLLDGLDRTTLVRRYGGRWSLQENAGHLMALEPLFVGRLDDFEAGAPVLRAADMSNQATEAADFNQGAIGDILEGFARVRGEYVGRLRAKGAVWFSTVARHPRLNQPMRVVDQLEFQIAHDQHHFGRIDEILASLDDEA